MYEECKTYIYRDSDAKKMCNTCKDCSNYVEDIFTKESEEELISND